jgi:hypothetical protein
MTGPSKGPSEDIKLLLGLGPRAKDDNMQIKFKMLFSSGIWAPIYFNGRSDPERDALTGVWGTSTELENSLEKKNRRIPHRIPEYQRTFGRHTTRPLGMAVLLAASR